MILSRHTVLTYAFFLGFIAYLIPSFVSGQEFQKNYLQGKEYYKAAKYGPAMEVLLPITKDAADNNFEEYAHYFYSLAAFKANKMNEAYQMLLQLINKYPQWHNIEDAYYLAANTAFELKKYRYGLNFLKDRSPKMKTDIDALKENYFIKLFPMDSLKSIQKSYPQDPVLAKVLLKRIYAGQVSEKDKMLTDYLIQEFKIQPTDISDSRKSILKDAYNVAVLFPFMLKELAVEGTAKSNPFAAEMYAGIQMAIDSLRQKRIKVNVYAYDTEKDNFKIQEILKLPELKSMDLIIGPLIPAHNTFVNQFALANLIETVNPLSNNLKLTDGNEYVYLFQPSLERQAQQVADFAYKNLPTTEKKNVFIFYSDNPRDSLLALSYRDSIIARKFSVPVFEQVNKDRLAKVTLTLSDSGKVVTANHVFIASADQNVATNVISALEISQLVTPVFTRSEWLQFPLLSFEQLQRRQIHFIYPDFIRADNYSLPAFKKAYTSRMNNFPNIYSYTGYELMTYFGKSLFAYGNYVKDGFNRQGFVNGTLYQGYNYSFSNDNQSVPIVKFEENTLKQVNAPE